jgi:hypothetical protein
MRGEMSSAMITLVLLGMATFVAYMRFPVTPIQREEFASRAR